MVRQFSSPAGISDFLPEDHRYFTLIKKVARHRFRQAGFVRISPPTFEDIGIYRTALGVNSSTLNELYQFTDRQDRTYALAPDMTPGIVRAFIQNELHENPLPLGLYYVNRCFQFHRPTKYVRRESWQIGLEILGESDPSLDTQLIYIAHQILSDLKLRESTELVINSLGSRDDMNSYFSALADFYGNKLRSLSPESLEQFNQQRYLELLSPKTEDEEILLKMAPHITDFLSEESKDHFNHVCEYLDVFNIKYRVDPFFIRPQAYYTGIIFSFIDTETKLNLIDGGRYDNLIEDMGGPDMSGSGFTGAVNNIVTLMQEKNIEVVHKDTVQLFIAVTGPLAKKEALPFLVQLREHGFHTIGVLGKTSITAQLKRAQGLKVPYTLLMGDDEVKTNMVILRDMKTGKQQWIPKDDILGMLDDLLGAPSALDNTIDFLGHE